MNYSEIIKINPNKRFGKPCIRDTRITVWKSINNTASPLP